MSSARSHNKFCLSLDNTSSNTSSNTVHLSRWSEVVPPKTALTFAALWDPEEGMVTFTGAALLESESPSGHSGVFDGDGHSQFISFDHDSSDRGTATGENTAALATFQDAFKAFLHRTPWNSREHLSTKAAAWQGTSRCSQTRASSTFDGLDVYSHDIRVKPKRSLQLSCSDLLDIDSSFRAPSAFGRFKLRSDLMLDSYCSKPEERVMSRSGSRLSYLRSRFSTTTTSTSNYVDVTVSAPQSTRTSEASLPIPNLHHNECISPASSWPSLPQRRRLLRKRPPLDSVATASASSGSVPSTPRKANMRGFMARSSLAASPSSTVTPSSPRGAALDARWGGLRGRFPRTIIRTSVSRTGTTSMPSSTLPATPSKSCSSRNSDRSGGTSNVRPRTKLRLSFFLLGRKWRRRTSSDDSDGWVFIEVAPFIRQHYVASLDQED